MSEKSDHDLLIEIHTTVQHIAKKLEDHEARIRPLEAQQHKWLGRDGAIVAGISMGVSVVVALITWLTGGGLR